MDKVRFNKDTEEISIEHYYSEEPIISIYENISGDITFELTDGEYTAALTKADVHILIQYLQEIVKHEVK